MNVRLSTTTLESFRLYTMPDQEWMSDDDLLKSIRGEIVETPELRIGRAFDRVLEQPEKHRVSGGYFCEGQFFADAVMTPALALFDPRGVWQVRATKGYGEATVVAKADQLVGAAVVENKTTFNTFDVHKYADSYQWRFYLDVFGAAFVTYHVFCLGDDRRTGDTTLRSIETFRLYPYADLHRDCRALVERFLHYIDRRHLTGLLEQRQVAAEARVGA